MPIIVHAENCDDGTDEWLKLNEYNVEYHIDHNDNPKGIGGGMNFCVDKVKTEFVNIIHSDMWIAPDQDIELLKLYDDLESDKRLIASSFRIQPKIFPNDPDYRPGTVFVDMDEFGAYAENFDFNSFDEWASEFSKMDNDYVRKAGGAGYFCRVEDHIWIGGNDPRFEPMYWEDKDLFMRMQMEDYKFIMTSKSVVWHFASRTSRFPNSTKNLKHRPPHLVEWEKRATQRFIEKWGRLPQEDNETFVIPITGTDNPNRIEWPFDE